MAIAKYILQGVDNSVNHYETLKEVLEHQYNEIYIYSAYLRKNAVVALEKELRKSSENIVAVVGIRNGATSIQGLKCLYDTGVKVYVVDTGCVDAIFHSKTYLGIGDRDATAVIGSANFTPSGLSRNIENSCILTLDLTDKDDKLFLSEFREGFKKLTTEFEENTIRITSGNQIQDLFDEGRIVDEEKKKSITRVGTNIQGERIVPRMKLKVKTLPITKNEKKKKKRDAEISVFAGTETLMLQEVWKSKPLVRRDLNIPGADGTQSTGSMLLKKGTYEVNQQTYFRKDVFSELEWSTEKGKPDYFEYAKANFRFVIDGVEYRKYSLSIKFDTRTNTTTYLQKQPMTHLIWGEAKGLIANSNLLGKTLTLYSVEGMKDEFVIKIQ